MNLPTRRLPHLYALDRPLFITFRLHDSLPANRPFGSAQQLTSGQAFVAMDRLLDEARTGPTYLKDPEVAHAVLETLQHGAETNYFDLHVWVLMPNHVHLLLTPRIEVSRLLRSLKSASAKQANLILARTGQPFWQDESYDHLVRTEEEFRRITRYIENNPVKACLSPTPESYRWSSKCRRAI